MKFCSKCGAQCDDNATACPNCEAIFVAPAAAAPVVDPDDHTAEFDPRDISDNKVIAMLPYILGPLGLIIAMLMTNTSKYVTFHIRTALKFTVVESLLFFVNIIPFLGWLVYVVCIIICLVLRIIAFFQICCGKAKDPAIISSLGFLK